MMGPNGTNLHVAGNAADDSNSLLAWNHHQAVLIQSMKSMRHSCDFSDVTLCAEGELFKAHRFVLSSCSEYMKTLLTHTVDYSNPFVIIDASKDHVKMMLDYMYYGEVTIRDKDINGFLEAAQKLRIMGLLLSYANATEEVPPVDSQETPNTSIQKTMELAHVHADYMLDKYRNNASTPTHHQLIRPKPSAFLTDELRSRSPPPKRQRVSALPLAAAAMHHMLPPLNLDTNNKNTTKSTKKEVEPAFLGLTNGPSTLPRNTTNNIKPSRYVPEMISNHDPHSTTFTTLPSTHTNATATTSTTVTTASDTTANVNADLNNSTASSEFNPLPLVKVELQTDEEESCLMMDCSANSPPSPCEPHATDTKVFDATATAPSNMSAFGIDGTGTVPVNQNPEVEQKLMEPLTEGAGPSGAGGSIQQLIAAAAAAAEADVPAGTSEAGGSSSSTSNNTYLHLDGKSTTSTTTATTTTPAISITTNNNNVATIPTKSLISSSFDRENICKLVISNVESIVNHVSAGDSPDGDSGSSESFFTPSLPELTITRVTRDIRTTAPAAACDGSATVLISQRSAIQENGGLELNFSTQDGDISIISTATAVSSLSPVKVSDGLPDESSPLKIRGKDLMEDTAAEQMILEPVIIQTEDGEENFESVSIKQENLKPYQETMESPYFAVSHSLFDSTEPDDYEQHHYQTNSSSSPVKSEVLQQGYETGEILSGVPLSSAGDIGGSIINASVLASSTTTTLLQQQAPHYYAKTSYICAECGKCFVSAFSLSVHSRGHSEDRPHQCPHCDYKAKLKHHIKCHVKRRHPRVDE